MARPDGINDLQMMWAIRDLSSDLVTFQERGFLFYLLSVIGNKESCYYSLAQLEQILGISQDTIRRYTKSLSDKKLIKVVIPLNQGRGHAKEYYLCYEQILNQKDSKLRVAKTQQAVDNSEERIAKKPSFNSEGSQITPPLNEKGSQIAAERVANFPPQDIKKDIHKEKRESALSSFQPNKEHIAYAQRHRINIDEELNSFKNKTKHKENLDFYFSDWLKKALEYQQNNSYMQSPIIDDGVSPIGDGRLEMSDPRHSYHYLWLRKQERLNAQEETHY